MAITDYLSKIQFLANQNLDLLEAFSKSFNTNDYYVKLDVAADEKSAPTTYLIPSFVTINNQLNDITNSISSITNVDEKGFAKIDVGSNSKMINTLGYLTAPMPIDLNLPNPDENLSNNFLAINNHLLKDYVFPNVSLNFNLDSIQNIVKDVVVRKVVFKTSNINAINNIVLNNDSELTDNICDNSLTTDNTFIHKEYFKKIDFETLYKALKVSNLIEDVDYEIYDKVYKLPRREVNYFGEYVIEAINNNYIAGDLNQVYELTVKNLTEGTSNDLNNQLTYRIIDDANTYFGVESLHINDILISYDRQIKFKVLNINGNKITIKVLNNQYITFKNAEDAENTVKNVENTLLFFAPSQSVMNNIENETVDGIDTNNPNNVTNVSFDKYKYLNVPLEENQFICIFIAPIFSETNVQAIFGKGVFLNTYKLSITDSLNNNTYFKDYYDNQVLNIGDQIKDIAECFNGAFSFLSKEQIIALKTKNALSERTITIDENETKYPVILGNVQVSNDTFYTSKSYNDIVAAREQITIQENNISESNNNIKTYENELNKPNLSSTEIANYNNKIHTENTNKTNYYSVIQDQLNIINNSLKKDGLDIVLEPVKYYFNGVIDVLGIIEDINKNTDVLQQLPKNVSIIGFEVYYQYFTADGERQITLDGIEGNNIYGEDGNYKYQTTNWKMMEIPTYFYKDIVYNSTNNNLSYRRDYPSLVFPDYFKDNLEVHFNDIKIPMYPGTQLQIKYRYIYSTGFPFIRFTSNFNNSPIKIYFTQNGKIDGDKVEDVVSITEILSDLQDKQNEVDIVNTFNEYGTLEHLNNTTIVNNNTYNHTSDKILYNITDNGTQTVKDTIDDLYNKFAELDNMFGGAEALTVSIVDDIRYQKGLSATELTANATPTNYRLSAGYMQDLPSEYKEAYEEYIVFPFTDYHKHDIELRTWALLRNYINSVNANLNTMMGQAILECTSSDPNNQCNAILFNKMPLHIKLKNNSNAQIKLYTLFPKGRNQGETTENQGYFNDEKYLTANIGKYSRYDYGAYIAERKNEELGKFWGFLFKETDINANKATKNTDTDLWHSNVWNNTNLNVQFDGQEYPYLTNPTIKPQELNQYAYFRAYNLYDTNKNLSAYNNVSNGFTNSWDVDFNGNVIETIAYKTYIYGKPGDLYTTNEKKFDRKTNNDNQNLLFVKCDMLNSNTNTLNNLMPLSYYQSPKYWNIQVWNNENNDNPFYKLGINQSRFDEIICNYSGYGYDYNRSNCVLTEYDYQQENTLNKFKEWYSNNRNGIFNDCISKNGQEQPTNPMHFGFTHLSLVPYTEGGDDNNLLCNEDGIFIIPANDERYLHVMAYYCIFYYVFDDVISSKKTRTNVNSPRMQGKSNDVIIESSFDITQRRNDFSTIKKIYYSNLDIAQTLQFDILTSPYKDPQTYTVNIIAHLPETQDLISGNGLNSDNYSNELQNDVNKQTLEGGGTINTGFVTGGTGGFGTKNG